MSELEELVQSLEDGNSEKVVELTKRLLGAGASPQTVLNNGLIVGMGVVGEKMRIGEMYLPEVLQSATAMHASLKILKPLLAKDGVEPLGRIVMGTVKGDIHDIGKNLVGILLQGAGFEIVDLGVNVTPQKFVDAIEQQAPAMLAISAMLTTTMLNMKGVIEAIGGAGHRSKVKIIVGGAPVSEKFAEEIGADGYARDAVKAVDKVKELLAIG